MARPYNRKTLEANFASGEIQELLTYLMGELEAIERAFDQFDLIRLRELNSEPEKPRAGQIVLADGTQWDPGSGAGFYGYYGGAWVKLG